MTTTAASVTIFNDLTSTYSDLINDINDQGEAVGASAQPVGQSYIAAAWLNGTPTALANVSGSIGSNAWGINNSGEVVGTASFAGGSSQAVLWQNGTVTALTPVMPQSVAKAINDQGVVIGQAGAGTIASPNRAFVWQNGTLSYLPTQVAGLSSSDMSNAVGINNSGQIVGWASTGPSIEGLMWQNGATTDLGAWIPAAINDAGTIVGAEGNDTPCIWQNGTLTTLSTGAFQYADPHSINDSGLIVGQAITTYGGEAAVLWQNGALVNLNSLLPSGSPWTLKDAVHINNQGIIIGQGTLDGNLIEYEFVLGSNSVGVSIQTALTSFRGGQLSSAVTIIDSAANLQANLDALQTLAAAGKLGTIGLTDSATPSLSVTGTQFSNDAAVLAAVGGAMTLTVSGSVTAASLTPGLVADLTGPVSVSDSAADVQASLAALEQAATAGKLSSITLTDSSSSPVLTISGTQFGDTAALEKITGNYRLTIEGGVPVASLVPSLLAHTGSVAVLDSTSAVVTGLDQLESLVTAGTVTSITLTDARFTPTFYLSAAQLANDGAALALISGPYNVSVDNLTAMQAVAAAHLPALSAQSTLMVTDSSADILANLDALAPLAKLGALRNLNFTDAAPSTLTISGTQLAADLPLIKLFTPFPKLNVTSATTTAAAVALFDISYATTSSPLTISDSAADLQGSIDALEAGASQGKLGSITLTDTGTAVLTLTSAQVAADGDVLKKITSPYTVNTSGAVTAQQAATGSPSTPIAVSDTVANIQTNLSGLENLANKGLLLSISATDGASTPFSLYATDYLADSAALGKLTGAYTVFITDFGSETMTAADAMNALAKGYHFASSVIQVTDTAAHIGSAFDQLEAASAAGNQLELHLSDSAPITLTPQQITSDGAVIVSLERYSGNFTLSLSGPLGTDALGSLALLHVSQFSVSDSAAHVFANLDTLEQFAESGKLTSVSVTDSAFATVTISSAQLVSDADALAKISGNYTLLVAASGSGPSISGPAGHGTVIQFSGAAASYSVSSDGKGLTVTGPTGTEHVSGITALKFSDFTDIVAQTPGTATVTTGNITELYGAAFGREPDVAGLAYYQNELTTNPTLQLTTFAQSFLASPEYTQNAAHNYAQTSAGDAQFVTDSYQNLLGRAPEAGAVAYYQNIISTFTQGLSAGTQAYTDAEFKAHALVITDFSQSPEFVGDVTVTAQHPSSSQHWLVLI